MGSHMNPQANHDQPFWFLVWHAYDTDNTIDAISHFNDKLINNT